VDANVFFYRKDVFGAKGVAPPNTLAELEPLVQKLHAPPGTYGIVLRGLKNANATQYPSILFPMGGTYLKDGKAALDTKEQVAALELYTRLLRQYGPPGVVNFNWYECSAAFMQGQVACYMDGVNFASQFEDAGKSKVVGKVGYAVLPSGPGGHRHQPHLRRREAIGGDEEYLARATQEMAAAPRPVARARARAGPPCNTLGSVRRAAATGSGSVGYMTVWVEITEVLKRGSGGANLKRQAI
jgi:Bacterial extracellular solute-binding protein